MKTLSKLHKDRIETMINNGDRLFQIEAYCLGAGIDTKSYSSPIHIENNKLTMKYRRENKYFYIY